MTLALETLTLMTLALMTLTLMTLHPLMEVFQLFQLTSLAVFLCCLIVELDLEFRQSEYPHYC